MSRVAPQTQTADKGWILGELAALLSSHTDHVDAGTVTFERTPRPTPGLDPYVTAVVFRLGDRHYRVTAELLDE